MDTPTLADRSDERRVDVGRIVSPRSIAVVGASPEPHSIAGQTMLTLEDTGFDGSILPVNPRYEHVHGQPCVPSLSDLTTPPDLVVVAVAAERAVKVLEDSAAAGVGAAVVLSAGFAEARANGSDDATARLDAVIRDSDLRVLGPNNQGFVNMAARTAVTFSPVFRATPIREQSGFARFAMVSQSGALAFALYRAGTRRGMCFSHIVTTGNEADVDVIDVLHFLADDDETEGVIVYAEGIRRLDQLVGALRRLSSTGKPVVVAKVGRSHAGSRAALSHTAHLAGDDKVVDAVLHAGGAVRAVDQDDVIDYTLALASRRPFRGRRVGVVTTSGGAGVWLADASEGAGLVVPEFGGATLAAIESSVPNFGTSTNPVDLTASMGDDPFRSALEAVSACTDVDLVGFNTLLAPDVVVQRKVGSLRSALEGVSKPLFVYSQVGVSEEAIELFAEAGVPHYESPGRAAASIAAAARYFSSSLATEQGDRPVSSLRSAAAVVAEHTVKGWLRDAGLNIASGQLVKSAADAAEAAGRASRPMVLKVHSGDVPHKARVGGVVLDICSPAAAEAAYDQIRAAVSAAVPGVDCGEMLLEEMVHGTEYIVGALSHEIIGPAVLVGRGGSNAEQERGAVLRLAPVTPTTAREMVELVRGCGSDPAPAVAAEVMAIAEVVVFASHAIADPRTNVAELDLNPVAYNSRNGAVVLDALARLQTLEGEEDR